ncbi:hypothetical protein FOL46_008681 [Perkinsus olseni]|uniref:Uncharacterized protein n=1 Tax=Perkinsus olseni TaxID=32597 RepID=A0A7J6MMD5_PEROL|nr:hypothetical protein FOL46_008681 [Perkinsus olseni]
MPTANASSSSNAASRPPPPPLPRTPLSSPLSSPVRRSLSFYDEEPVFICCDGTRLPRAPMLGPEKSPTDHLSDIMLSDDASFSTDESPPHTAHLSRRHLPPVAKKYYTPTSLQTTSSSPASADQSAVNHDVPPKDRKKKPQALDLAINTDIDDNEVDARFVNAIRSRRLNLSEPVFGTLEYYRMQLRAHATPIYWKDYDPLPEPVRYRPMPLNADLMYFYAPPPPLAVVARRSNPGHKTACHCVSFDWLVSAFQRFRSRMAWASE